MLGWLASRQTEKPGHYLHFNGDLPGHSLNVVHQLSVPDLAAGVHAPEGD